MTAKKNAPVLKLAINDPEFGPQLSAVRVLTPAERDAERRMKEIRKHVDQARLLASGDEKAANLRARLEAAMDDIGELHKLEEMFVPKEDRIRMGTWVHGEGEFATHEEADIILRFLTRHYRTDLRGNSIVVVFQEKIPPVNRKDRMGTAAKLPGKMRFLSNYDAVITLGWEQWIELSDADRQRLVHHEIEHLEHDDGLKLRGHDFEDFASIIELYGLRSESGRFATDGRNAEILMSGGGSQLELIDRAG